MLPLRLSVRRTPTPPTVVLAAALVALLAVGGATAQQTPPLATPDGRTPSLEAVPTTTAATLDPDRVESLVGRHVATAEGLDRGVVATVARGADGRAATLGVTFEGAPLVAVRADRAVVEAETGRLRLVDVPAESLAELPPFR
jgi:hypothetical protein